ncbi:MAG TPA: hypothetical protein VG323_11905 [Thermoanaerobaculia bacterium]|nr:hypothetical protein [Thermoanaerobaculia bacterium]
MAERDRPFVRVGVCLVCKAPAHDRVLCYADLSVFLKHEVSTLKTWTSLQNKWLEKAHPNREIALAMLKRTVNGRPRGAPMFLHVEIGGKRRTFRPLPPMIAPARFCGCCVSAYLYSQVLLGPVYDPEEHIAARNLRKQIGGQSGPPSPRTPHP